MPAAAAPGHPRPDTLRVAILGGGTVGAHVVRLLGEQSRALTARTGARLEVCGVAVRDLGKPRPGIDPALLTDDAAGLVASGPDIVIELIGGISPARELVLAAMANGASVVTANKALVATHGAQLHEAAAASGVDLYYEAAVAGAIPLLRPLRESLAGDQVTRVLGIVNGTTNYILSRMDSDGADFATALSQAQALGYAEADPTADVGGLDAAAKAAILAGLAFHTRVTLDDVSVSGITDITSADIVAARELGFGVKLLAIAELVEDGGVRGVCVRVHPALVPLTHPLAGVRSAFNAVFIEAQAAGQVMFYGRGAGGEPTASAVLGDLVTVARNRLTGSTGPGESAYRGLPIMAIGSARTAYSINLKVADQPGVLAAVAQTFADNQVSIQSVRQGLGQRNDDADGAGQEQASLLVLTHQAREADLAATVLALRRHPAVEEVRGVIRVIGSGQ